MGGGAGVERGGEGENSKESNQKIIRYRYKVDEKDILSDLWDEIGKTNVKLIWRHWQTMDQANRASEMVERHSKSTRKCSNNKTSPAKLCFHFMKLFLRLGLARNIDFEKQRCQRDIFSRNKSENSFLIKGNWNTFSILKELTPNNTQETRWNCQDIGLIMK